MAPILGLAEDAKRKAREVEDADEIEDYMTMQIQEPRRMEPETSLQRSERKKHEV